MKEITDQVPLLEEVQIHNPPMPLWYAHWTELANIALQIRQHIARPLRKGGLDFSLTQYENTQRGIVTLRGQVSYKQFIREQSAGVAAWLQRLCTLINLKTFGSKPIEKIRLVRTRQGFLAYYGGFYSNQIEIVIYIGSGEDIDGATVIHLERSKVDEETRDWKLLAQQLPATVWVPSIP